MGFLIHPTLLSVDTIFNLQRSICFIKTEIQSYIRAYHHVFFVQFTLVENNTFDCGIKLVSEYSFIHSFIHSFILLACAECDDSLPFSGASSIPLCYIPIPSTLFHQLVFHPPSLHLTLYFLVYLSALFPNSYIILFWEFSFLPFCVHAQTNIIYLTLLSLLYWVF